MSYVLPAAAVAAGGVPGVMAGAQRSVLPSDAAPDGHQRQEVCQQQHMHLLLLICHTQHSALLSIWPGVVVCLVRMWQVTTAQRVVAFGM
jgi:hypothetical protein